MNNYHTKSAKFIQPKPTNLSELSISEIWENKFAEQNSDFQQEHYLIKAIRDNQKVVEDQYGLQLRKNDKRNLKTKIDNVFQNQKNYDPSNFQSNNPKNSLDKNYSLKFNKQIKRKNSCSSKQKVPHQVRSSKNILSTKPVPNIHQHSFKQTKQSKLKLTEGKFTQPSKPVTLKINNSKYDTKTNLYQIPLRHKKYQSDSKNYPKLYYLMPDQAKIEVNDFNCDFINNPVQEIKNQRSVFSQQPDITVKNHRNRIYVADKNQQFTYLNDTNAHTSYMISSVGDTKIYELKRPSSLDSRNESIYSSCKTDRCGESPFSRDSNKTTKKVEKLKPVIFSKKNENQDSIEVFYRNNNGIQNRGKHCIEYFVDGYSQDIISRNVRNNIFLP